MKINRTRSEIIICTFLILATLVVFGQVRKHEFITYDDQRYVTQNLRVRDGWTADGLVWAFTTRHHLHWHPLTWLSHMTDCQIFGLNPGSHHLVSLFFHIANTLLLFWILKKMTAKPLRSAFVAALFALHPLHVETVAWIADRKDLLYTFFWLLAMLAYLHYAAKPNIWRYSLVFLLFILSLMSKPMAITLPVVLLLMDYWPLNRIDMGQSNSDSRSRTTYLARNSVVRLLGEKAIFVLPIIFSAILTVVAMQMKRTTPLSLSKLLPTFSLIKHALFFYGMYIFKTIWPFNLAIPYPYPKVLPLWKSGAAGVFFFGTTFTVFWKGRKHPYLPVGWCWYLITLLPVIGLLPLGPHKLADRYTYLPLIGFFIIIAWGVPDLVTGWIYRQKVLAVSSALLISTLMIISWQQVRVWKDSISLFKHAIDVTVDNDIMHLNLGYEYLKMKRHPDAIFHFSEVIRIDPDSAPAYYNLGLALEESGRREEAIGYYFKAIKLKPELVEAYNNLGVALARTGRTQEAVEQLSRALRIKPDYVTAKQNLEKVLRQMNRSSEKLNYRPPN